jgi:hypothetical protein
MLVDFYLLTTLPQQSYHLVLKYGSKLQNTQIREESLKGKSEAVSRRGTDNAMVKRRNQFSTNHYLENHKLTSMDPTNILGALRTCQLKWRPGYKTISISTN